MIKFHLTKSKGEKEKKVIKFTYGYNVGLSLNRSSEGPA